MTTEPTSPAVKTFISYAWTSDAHKNRVRALADRLIGNGIDVVLDQYHLREGDDPNAFMEQVAARGDVQKVIAICDPKYVKRMNAREGGSGQEGTIMSPHVYDQLKGTVGGDPGARQRRFVAVIFDRDPDLPENSPNHLPTMFASSVYIDMSTDELLDENFETLMRFLLDKPALVAPPLGQVPAYLRGDAPPALPSRAQASALRRAVEQERNVEGAFQDYLDQVVVALNVLPPVVEDRHFDMSRAVDAANQFTPVRDEWTELVRLLTRRGLLPVDALGDFFERLMGLCDQRSEAAGQATAAFAYLDVLRVELILYGTAILMELRAVDALRALTERTYFVQLRSGQQAVGFGYLHNVHAEDMLNEQYKLFTQQLWLAPIGAWLKSRASLQTVGWTQLLEADVLLFLKSAIERQEDKARGSVWLPRTGPFWEHRGPVPLFERFVSRRVLTPWLPFFRASTVEEARRKLEIALPGDLYGKYIGGKWDAKSMVEHLSLERLGSLS